MTTRVPKGTKTSLSLVMTTRYPYAARTALRRCATSRVMVFSGTRWPGMPPRSKPPWPASITTVVEGSLSEIDALLVRVTLATGVELGVFCGPTFCFSRAASWSGGGKAWVRVATDKAPMRKIRGRRHLRIANCPSVRLVVAPKVWEPCYATPAQRAFPAFRLPLLPHPLRYGRDGAAFLLPQTLRVRRVRRSDQSARRPNYAGLHSKGHGVDCRGRIPPAAD